MHVLEGRLCQEVGHQWHWEFETCVELLCRTGRDLAKAMLNKRAWWPSGVQGCLVAHEANGAGFVSSSYLLSQRHHLFVFVFLPQVISTNLNTFVAETLPECCFLYGLYSATPSIMVCCF